MVLLNSSGLLNRFSLGNAPRVGFNNGIMQQDSDGLPFAPPLPDDTSPPVLPWMGGPADVPLPGAVSGFGGGTFDYGPDGRMVERTPVQRATVDAPRLPDDQSQKAFDPALVAQAPKLARSWSEGGKFKAKDAAALALAAVGDALARNEGGQGNALSNIMSARDQAIKRNRVGDAMRKMGYSDDQVELAMTNPEAFGTNFNQQFGTRVVAPGSSVVGGTASGQRSAYSQPTSQEAYALSLGLKPGTTEYNTAMQDYILRGNGPTAYGFDTGLDDHRTSNDGKLEDQRQRNRLRLRGAPTYRDLNPPPPRQAAPASAPRRAARPTATGPNGKKVEWDGKAWVPVQ
jgi:hypothetical protein